MGVVIEIKFTSFYQKTFSNSRQYQIDLDFFTLLFSFYDLVQSTK